MFRRLFHGLILLALLTGLLVLIPAAPAAASMRDRSISPEGLLKTDGTLKLDGDFSGALDLSGYSVQIDPVLGPVFTPLAAQGNWVKVGTGGGPFTDFINAVVVAGTDVYVGGGFQNAGGIPEADNIARWDGSQWLALGNGGAGSPALNSQVVSMLYAGGNLYAAGWFNTFDTSGVPIGYALRFARWNGSAWSAVPGMTSPLNDGAKALAYDPTNHIIYVGGNFTNVNGNTAADRVFGIDLDTDALVTLGNNGASEGSLNQSVNALAVDSSGAVFAGGFFTNVMNGVTTLNEADYIAKWDGSDWSALGNNGSGGGALNNAVAAIAIDASDNVYAGGSFFNAAGIAAADYIAKWSGSAWSALGSNGAGDGALVSTGFGGSPVQNILVNGTDVYVSGYFTGSSGIPTADYVARFDTTGGGTWSGLGSNGSGDGALNGGVVGMAMSAGKLYVGGVFYDANNSGTVLPIADRFAVWDGSNWSTLGEANGPFVSGVKAMAVIGTDVYVGGDFIDAGSDPRMDYIARWDGSKWNPVGNLTQSDGSISGPVLALAVDGTDLYVGGEFTAAYNEGTTVTGASMVAKWNGSTWSALVSGVNGMVKALAVDGSHNLYVGGFFVDAGSVPEADYIAKWNGSAWSALAGNGSGSGALDGVVYSLGVSGANVYVGGNFTTVVNTSNVGIPNTAHLARWNGSAWSAMDGLTQPVDSNVYAIAVSGSNVYVGGGFNNLNGIPAADWIAKWNGSTWSALGDNSLGGGSLNNNVNAIAVKGNQVVAGGIFTNVVNADSTILAEADYAAMWNGSSWRALGNDGAGNGSLNATVRSLMILNYDLWVAGDFQNVNNSGTVVKEADRLAVYGMDIPPAVTSITRANPSPTSAPSVGFTVTFSEPVLNVDKYDFTLTVSGLAGVSISAVTGTGATRTVTVKTGTGIGTIRLNIPNTATITDTIGNNLGGLPYLGGQVYSVKKRLTFLSIGKLDGHILESGENSNVGGTLDSTSATFYLGDGAADKQYRAILTFNTGLLPDTAVITRVTLKIKKQGLQGTDPFTILGGLKVDMRKPFFGTTLGLVINDFQASAGKSAITTFSATPEGSWYSAFLNAVGWAYVNKTGTTQFRLRFYTGDNDDGNADYMRFYSGNYVGAASRPSLIVEYYVP